MENPLVWVGVIGLLLTFGGLLFTVANHIYSRIAAVDAQRSRDVAELHAKIEAAKSELQTVIDKIKDDYVRRIDLQDDMRRIEGGQERIVQSVEDLAKEIRELLGKTLASVLAQKGQG